MPQVDALALWAIVARISEFGSSPNRVAALGEPGEWPAPFCSETVKWLKVE